MNTELIENARVNACAILQKFPETMLYHNQSHTMDVVQAVETISRNINLEDEELEMATIAAWFHDTGFLKSIDNHEEESVSIATTFLRQNNYPKEKTEKVAECIRATHLKSNPDTAAARVLIDADFFHLSKKAYFERQNLLRKEWEVHHDKKFTDLEWYKENYSFLKNHEYLTEYGKAVLESNKEDNP